MDQQTTSQAPKVMQARFAARCTLCGKQIHVGQMITWSREQGARCTTRKADYTTSPEHPAIVTSSPVSAPVVRLARDEEETPEPMFRIDTFDAI